MVQSSQAKRNALHELGYKIFLDRYAQKDMTRATLAVGDTVIVVVNSTTGQREVGKVTALDLPTVSIELLDGEVVTRDVEHVDKPLETEPEQMMDRVAAGIAQVETSPEKQAEWAQKFRWLLDDWKFVPGGRILAGAGTPYELTFFNCFVLPPIHDSRGGIFERLQQMAEIMSRGGGVGINVSTLRPRFSYVKGVNGRSSGAVSWAALYSYVTGLIEQAGSRRGALMVIMNDWHPDVFDFVNSKRTAGQITNANISVNISDPLMQAIKDDGDWELVFPDTSDPDYDELWDGDIHSWRGMGKKVNVYRKIKARELWDTIIESAWASAEPGLWFGDRSNKMSNSYYYPHGKLIATNPCGEQPLPGFGICNLGALNLACFDLDGQVDWEQLGTAVRYGVRFLDNVIDSTPYFFEANYEQQMLERRVGLGIMGLAELLIKCGVRYGSDESVEFIDNLFEFITSNAYLASTEIAREKGAFPAFKADKYLASGFMEKMPTRVREAVKQNGIRNVTLLTVAPTGTTGTMVNTSTGVEPFFSWSYYRKSRLGLHEEKVPLVRDWFAVNPGATELPEYFVTAMSLAPKDHVRVQAAIQRWVDSAISKTSNLPNEYTIEQVSELYQYMYDLGCKGGTVYRDGSRSEQVLMLKGDERAESEMEAKTKKEEAHKQPAAETAIVAAEKNIPAAAAKASLVSAEKISQVATPHRVYPRPVKLQGVTINCATPFGTAYVTMNSDEHGYPFEVFITAPGKAGSDLQADAEGLGRMMSLSLRTTDPHNRRDMLKLIIDQLRDIGGSRSIGFGERRVISLPDSVARAM
ncbi:MAG: adenosylcobalamin-dependent ribonucleoside-diphosphate reductase, partial [Chitinophagaceae bacterium]|nr:adenosylcobalamin-dependent ribonucleoside-diphosphate reductase [Anaerolineae bacterium]